MARLAKVSDSESDSDFPDIADIPTTTRQKQNVTCRKPSSMIKRGTKSRSLREDGSDSESGLRRSPVKQKGIARKESGVKDEEKPKPRKRVLKQASDNPLLRPLPSSTITAVASESQESMPREKGWVTKTREPKKRSTRGIAIPVRHNSLEDPLAESDDDGFNDMLEGFKNTTIGKDRKRTAERRKLVAKHYFLEEASIDGGCSEDEEDVDGSDGMSDFIVNDSCILTEGESDAPSPPPRSNKKLVKGRKPTVSRDEDMKDLAKKWKSLSIEDEKGRLPRMRKPIAGMTVAKEVIVLLDSSENEEPAERKPKTVVKAPKEKEDKATVETKQEVKLPNNSSEIDEPFALLSFSPSENKPRKISQETRFTTPPPSPSKKGLISPRKVARIPMTPHRPSMDGFWNQDVINDWNEEYSPKKIIKPKPKPVLDDSGDLSEGALLFSPKKSPVKLDRAAKEAKKTFSQTKHALAESFLTELDEAITDGQISKLANSTGGVKIVWSKKLNTTAGRANWKRETIRSASLGSDRPPNPTYRHYASIELAEKVIDDEDRLLNVIAHEFCHLANFMISNIKTNPHGKEFKAWASKCSRLFGHRGIEVTTKHSYAIDYKYVWECEMCGTEFKRHSKSIDPAKHQCGSCKGKLLQTKPVPKKVGTGGSKISEYQVFFKENLKKVKEDLPPKSPQKEVMVEVGRRYQEYKASRMGKENVSVSVSEEPVGSRATSPGEEVAVVARKLNFLDLTNP